MGKCCYYVSPRPRLSIEVRRGSAFSRGASYSGRGYTITSTRRLDKDQLMTELRSAQERRKPVAPLGVGPVDGFLEDENGDLALLFPADVLARLGWTEGDVVEWQDTPQGVLVRKSLHSDSEL